MSQVAKDLLLILLRYVVVAGLTALATHHVISEEQLKGFLQYFTDPEVLGYGVLALGVVGTAAWSWFKSKQKLLTAIATPTAMTEQEVTDIVKSGAAPSVTTPKTDAPVTKPQPPKE